MARPYWSGQVTISLVSFAVDIYPATNPARRFQFHELDRGTGQRIHHLDVTVSSEDRGNGAMDQADKVDKVDKSDVVKGYEYEKGKYAIIEPEELKRLRIPGKGTFEIVQFSPLQEIDPGLYEKPYFVVPKEGPQAGALGVVRQAMIESGVAALGKIVFSGREHLAALASPPDHKQLGMMLYTLRFSEELRDAAEYFGKIQNVKVDATQLALAQQLIHAYARPFQPDEFKDDYEAAVRELVEAKVEHRPLPQEKPERRPGKVIDLMDALRRSVAARSTAQGGTSEAKPGAKPETRLKKDAMRAASKESKLKLVPRKGRKTA